MTAASNDGKDKTPESAFKPPGEVTAMLRDWGDGNTGALHELMGSVYKDLRKAAAHYLNKESANHTLQPTALINEVYLRLADNNKMKFNNRSQFFWFAGQLMRRILVEHARARLAQKRGSGEPKLSLDDVDGVSGRQDLDLSTLIALDSALTELEKLDSRQSKIIELRFFAGLNVADIAETLEISATTVKREWRVAKLWLARELGPKKS